jgi:hypothetical protein
MRKYWSDIKDYVSGDFKGLPLITCDQNMMTAFMRVYYHRFGKKPYTVTTKKIDGVKQLSAACPSGWLIMYFDGFDK